MSARSAGRRFRRNARYHGWCAASALLLLSVVRRFVTLERVLLYELDGLPDGWRCPEPGRIRLATVEEVRELSRDPEFQFDDMTESQVDALYGAGHRCVLTLAVGKVVGYGWIGFGDIEMRKVGIVCERRAHEGYLYKGFTHPEARGRGASNERFLFSTHHLLQQGKRSAVVWLSFDNPATLARVGKLGLRRLGAATLLGSGRHRYLRLSGDLRRRRSWPLPA